MPFPVKVFEESDFEALRQEGLRLANTAELAVYVASRDRAVFALGFALGRDLAMGGDACDGGAEGGESKMSKASRDAIFAQWNGRAAGSPPDRAPGGQDRLASPPTGARHPATMTEIDSASVYASWNRSAASPKDGAGA